MITFTEHQETGYAMRTWDNARLSDLTIALAIDFDTPGELLTRKAAYGKYYAVQLTDLMDKMNQSVDFLIKHYTKVKEIKVINFAGNGIYTLCDFGDQEFYDCLIYEYIKCLKINFPQPFSIRSGGQTGVDEAALKAADKLGLETICLAPKNWLFRDITGRDICDQVLFLKRFGPQYDASDIVTIL